MWTSKNRARYDRSELRYPSDLTDDEWRLVEPLIPPGKTGGGKRTVIMREAVNGLMYMLATGCQWRAIPKDKQPRSSVYDYFDLWTYDGTLERIHHALYERCREQAQRETSPTAAIIVFNGGGHRVERGLHLSAKQIDEHGRPATIRNMNHVDAGQQLKQLAGHVGRGPIPARAQIDLAWIGLGIGDELSDGSDRNRWVHLHDERHANDAGDRRYVTD